MKYLLLSLFILAPLLSFGQKTKKVIKKTDDFKEIFYVLKSDKSIKHGLYKKYNKYNNWILEKGNYNNGLREGNWIEYSFGDKFHEGNYLNNEKVGIWKYYEYGGKIISQEYNIVTNELIYFNPKQGNNIRKIIIDSDTLEISKKELERPAIFLGGDVMMIHHINSSIRYPAEARETGTEGTVVVQLTIDEEGKVTDYKMIRKLGKGLDEAAMDCLKKLQGTWFPAIYKGEKVKSIHYIPIKFQLG